MVEIGENQKNVFEALLKVQCEIQNPKNTANNPITHSNYVPLNELLDMVRTHFSKNGLILIQNTGTEEGSTFVQTIIAHKSGEYIKFDKLSLANDVSKRMNTVQQMGSAITYARRYQINSILSIAGEPDTDGNTGKSQDKVVNSNDKPKKQYTAKQSNNKKSDEDKGDEYWRALKFENELYAKVIKEFDEKEELSARLIRNKAADMVGEQKLTADEKKEIYLFIRGKGK